MATKRPIPQDVLQVALAQAQEQKASTGFSPTLDSNFPVMKPFLNQQIVVYVPNTNTVTVDGKETMQFVNSVRHQVNRGNFTEYVRCIHGLELEALGWDGECPLCKATEESWELYNIKLDAEAARQGLASAKDDPNEVLKTFKTQIGKERAVNKREAYLSYPLVVVPVGADKLPIQGGVPEVFIHDVRKGRYDDLMDKALKQLLKKPEHPNGLFLIFDYTYDTKGQQPNPRDAGKNLTVTVISSEDHLQHLKPLIPQLEEAAKEFTIEKINSVLVANQFMYKDEVEEIANKVMSPTRLQLAALREGQNQMLNGGGQPALGVPQANGNSLVAYGQPVQQNQQVDPNFNPMLQGMPQGNPLPNQAPPVQQGAPTPQGQPAPQGQPVPQGQPMQGAPVPQGQPAPQGAPTPPSNPLGQGTVPNPVPQQ